MHIWWGCSIQDIQPHILWSRYHNTTRSGNVTICELRLLVRYEDHQIRVRTLWNCGGTPNMRPNPMKLRRITKYTSEPYEIAEDHQIRVRTLWNCGWSLNTLPNALKLRRITKYASEPSEIAEDTQIRAWTLWNCGGYSNTRLDPLKLWVANWQIALAGFIVLASARTVWSTPRSPGVDITRRSPRFGLRGVDHIVVYNVC